MAIRLIQDRFDQFHLFAGNESPISLHDFSGFSNTPLYELNALTA
jgi:hypothetical protein